MLILVSVPTAASAAPTLVGEATWPGFKTDFPAGGEPIANAAPVEFTATLSEPTGFDWLYIEFPHKFNGTSIDANTGSSRVLPVGGLDAEGRCRDGDTLLFSFASNLSEAAFAGIECQIYTFDGGIGVGVGTSGIVANVSRAKITLPASRLRQISADRDLSFFSLQTDTVRLSALPLAFAAPPPPDQDGVNPQSTSGGVAVVRESAIHLKLLANPSDPVSGAQVEVVGTDLPIGSNYQLTVRSTPTVLINGAVTASGRFSGLIALPSSLPTGNHSLTLTATSRNGSTIQLVQQFSIARDGTFSSVGEVRPSGLSSELLAATGPRSHVMNLGLSAAVVALLAGVAALVARRYVLVHPERQ